MKPYSTEELAHIASVKPQSVRAAFCRDGHWCGIKPIKLPNRRLMWPAHEVEALLLGISKSDCLQKVTT